MTQRGEKILILSVATLVVISVALAAWPVIVIGRYRPPAPRIPLPAYETPHPNPIGELTRLADRLSADAVALRTAASARPLPATADELVQRNAAVRAEAIRLLSQEMLRPRTARGEGAGSLRTVGDLLALDARVAVKKGDVARALDSGCALLRLANVLARNGDAMAGMAGQQATTRAVLCLLQCVANGLSDAQLLRLREEVERAWKRRVPWSESLVGEWYDMDRQLEQWASGSLLDPNDGKRRGHMPHWLARWISSMVVGRARPETSAAMSALVADAKRPLWERNHRFPQPRTSLARMLMKVWADSAADVSGREAMRDACLLGLRTVTAVECYRRKTGTLPQRLEDLVPAYLAEVPVDPCDGHALRYVREGSGYRLYSVGPDRRDDYGKVRLVLSSDLGDLCLWPPESTWDAPSVGQAKQLVGQGK